MMNLKNYVFSLLAASCVSGYGNTNLDGLLREGSHWQEDCAAAAKSFSDFEWSSKDGVWSLGGDDLHLWNRPVHSFDMKSSNGHLRSLKVGLVETASKAEFSDALETWKAVMASRLNEEGAQSVYSSGNGTNLTLRWRKESYMVFLKGNESAGNYKLHLQYRPISAPPSHVAAEKDRLDGLYERTFYSPDYSKSFKGVVESYDENAMNLKISKGKSVITVNLDQLSDRDADYIEEVSGLIAAKNGLRIEIAERKDKPAKNGRAVGVDTWFDITLFNNSKSEMQEVEVRYDIFHKEDTLDGAPVLKKKSGSYQLQDVLAQYRESNTTDKISIVKESRPGISGG